MDSIKITALQLSTEGATYDLTAFEGEWSIGAIPSASCQIVTGRDLLDDRIVKWQSVWAEETEWTVTIFTTEGSKVLFTGYIQGVALNEAFNPKGISVSVKVQLASKAVALKDMNAAAYIYMATQQAEQDPLTAPIVATNQAITDIGPYTSETLFADQGVTDIETMIFTRFQEFLAKSFDAHNHEATAAASQGGEPSGEVLKHIDIASYDVAFKEILQNLGEGTMAPALQQAVMMDYVSRWSQGSVWDALTGTCGVFYLSVIPAGSQVRIMPLTPWKKAPDATITGSTVTTLSDSTDRDGMLFQPDYVRVINPLYNPDNAATEPSGDRTKRAIYSQYPDVTMSAQGWKGRVMTITLPMWLFPHVTAELIAKPPDQTRTDSDVRNESQRDFQVVKTEKTASDANQPSVCSAIARTYYAMAKNSHSKVSLAVLWNKFEFIDQLGYVIKVTDMSSLAVEKAYELYGMLSGVTLSVGRTGDAGMARMALSLTHVRDAEANNKFGLDDNPIYTVSEGGAAQAQAAPEADSPVGAPVLMQDTASMIPGYSPTTGIEVTMGPVPGTPKL